MPNPYKNKVVYSGQTLIDLTADTTGAGVTLAGYTGHDATGAPFVGAVIDGDEIGYGTEVLSDLTGTTWYFNTVPVLLDDIVYYINFTAGGVAYDGFEFYDHDEIDYWKNGMADFSAYRVSRGWNSQGRTITITGGTDATNSTLIAWMQANATQ